uniref:Uncharacterized protein n=1 Tax=Caenorhabditis tropicalis TaxID=1561998 RepID=A0A1I7UXG7_9PELO
MDVERRRDPIGAVSSSISLSLSSIPEECSLSFSSTLHSSSLLRLQKAVPPCFPLHEMVGQRRRLRGDCM